MNEMCKSTIYISYLDKWSNKFNRVTYSCVNVSVLLLHYYPGFKGILCPLIQQEAFYIMFVWLWVNTKGFLEKKIQKVI